mmetsp:Transcript_36973/g.83251  ORF Transcript_36973/g.83251 Transcript_36973/m.83251 type:complete len:504 (+) Transcript_36973:1382-2893(+)
MEMLTMYVTRKKAMTLKALASYVQRVRSVSRPAMACVIALNILEVRDLGGTYVWFSTDMAIRRAVASLFLRLTDEKARLATELLRWLPSSGPSAPSLAKDVRLKESFLAEFMEFLRCMPGRLLPEFRPVKPPLPSDPTVGRRRGPTCIAWGRNDEFSPPLLATPESYNCKKLWRLSKLAPLVFPESKLRRLLEGRRLGLGGGEASLSSTLRLSSGNWNDARFAPPFPGALPDPYLLGLSAGLAAPADDVVGPVRSGLDSLFASCLKLSLRSEVLLNFPMARARASLTPPPPSLELSSASSPPPPKFPNPDCGSGLPPRFLTGGGLGLRIAAAIDDFPSSRSSVDLLKLVILRASNIPSRLSSFLLGLIGTVLSSTSLDTPPFRSPMECIRLRLCLLRSAGVGVDGWLLTSVAFPSEPTLNVSLGSELERFPLDGFFFFFFFFVVVPPSASDWLCSDTPSEVELLRFFFFFLRFGLVPAPSSTLGFGAATSTSSDSAAMAFFVS